MSDQHEAGGGCLCGEALRKTILVYPLYELGDGHSFYVMFDLEQLTAQAAHRTALFCPPEATMARAP